MKKKHLILTIVIVFLGVLSGYMIKNSKIAEEVGEYSVGGYGTYLRELKCSVLKINPKNVIVVLEEETSSPEQLKKGDQLNLNFESEDQTVDPKKINLSEGEQITLTYLEIDESKKPAEVTMHLPTKIKGRY